MLSTTPTLQKRLPAIVVETARDDYSMRFVIRHRKPAKKMQPEQMAKVLIEAADYLESQVAGMREEARALVNGGAL